MPISRKVSQSKKGKAPLATYGPLRVLPFVNPSGTLAYRVTGTVLGKNVKKNFRSLQEAISNLEPIFGVLTNGMVASDMYDTHLVRTSLTDAMVADAEECYRRLRGSGLSLIDVVGIGLQTLRQNTVNHDPRAYLATALTTLGCGAAPTRSENEDAAEFAKRTNEARTEREMMECGSEADLSVAHYVATLEARNVKPHTVAVNRYIVGKFVRSAKITHLADITYDKLFAFVCRPGISSRTSKDQRARLYGYCQHLVDLRLIPENPVARIRPIRQTKKAIVIASVQQVEVTAKIFAEEIPANETFVQGAMLPRFLLYAFSPLRPEEITRLAPDWSNFNFEAHTVQITETKTGRENVTVEIDPRLSAALEHCADSGLSPNYRSRKHWEAWLAKGGIPRRVRDILRHTYASNCYAVDSNLHDLARRMNNSVEILRRHYLNTTVTRSEGRVYFDILSRYGG